MKKTLILLILWSCVASSYAQSIGPSTLNASGGSTVVQGKTFEYAIGSPISEPTFTSSALIVTPGVLQPFIQGPIAVQTPGIDPSDLNVYPNPVRDLLLIQPHFKQKGKLHSYIYASNGIIVYEQKVLLTRGNELQQVPMTSLASGQYFLVIQWISKGNTSSTTYKIQKLN